MKPLVLLVIMFSITLLAAEDNAGPKRNKGP